MVGGLPQPIKNMQASPPTNHLSILWKIIKTSIKPSTRTITGWSTAETEAPWPTAQPNNQPKTGSIKTLNIGATVNVCCICYWERVIGEATCAAGELNLLVFAPLSLVTSKLNHMHRTPRNIGKSKVNPLFLWSNQSWWHPEGTTPTPWINPPCTGWPAEYPADSPQFSIINQQERKSAGIPTVVDNHKLAS